MRASLSSLALWTAITAIALSLLLFLVKLYNWQKARIQGARRAHYIAAVGEILARGITPGFDRGWAEDPLFHDVLLQYVDVVAGEERAHLERLISSIDLRNRLVTQLRESRRESSRLAAASQLAVIATPEIEWALIEALQSPSPEVKIQAAIGLAAIRSERAIAPLVHMLLTEKPWVSARIADQLIGYGPLAVDLLMENIRDEHGGRLLDTATVGAVVRVLGLIGDLRAAPAIEPLLDHPELEVRVAAAGALAHAGTPDSVPRLVDALGDTRWEVRARAASALATFSDPSTTVPLSARLRDSSWWVRQNSAEALIEIPGGMDVLIDALEGDDAYARDAALQQLGLNGMIRAATDRVGRDEASAQDRRLVTAVALPGPIPLSERGDATASSAGARGPETLASGATTS